MEIGRDAAYNTTTTFDKDEVLNAHDPRLTFTYHEFPLQGLDDLLHTAVQQFTTHHPENRAPRTLVDLGSGCGRCVVHAALTAGSARTSSGAHVWDEVHGVEISPEMHHYAVERVLERGIRGGLLRALPAECPSGAAAPPLFRTTKLFFHLGDAARFRAVLSGADVVFCYSTVFEDDGFDPGIGAVLLSREWSLMLADACARGTVVVTTDRALNPLYGWNLERTMEVDNPSIFQSTGYISVRQ